MSCIPESHSMTNIISVVESPMEDKQRRGSRAYQIFPETNEDTDSYPDDFLYRRERLPSIVVEPTEMSEPESGELRWPPRCCMGGEQEDEEDSSGVQTEGDGEQQEDTAMEEGSRSTSRKSSIEPSQSQMSLSRLTPPASPTPPEAAPPCLRS